MAEPSKKSLSPENGSFDFRCFLLRNEYKTRFAGSAKKLACAPPLSSAATPAPRRHFQPPST
jgi:hypothetical protein